LDSIIKYTENIYELILVQEGEDEEITQLLKAYNVKFVHNRQPKGFAGAMNSGLKVAEGNIFVFLNNDTVVIPNWLIEILEVFKKDPQIGLISPTYTEAKKWQSVDRNQGEEITYIEDPLSLKGVCFAVKKEVMDKIGHWDESFGLGGGDDNDICLRTKNAGYKLAVARKSYIYHYGSASFRELFDNDIPYSKKFATGQFNKLRKKHNMDKKPKVYIAIPAFDGFIHCELTLRLLQWSHDPTIDTKIRFYTHLSPLDNARNQAVKDFLEDYWDYLLFIDNDIIPPSDALPELLKANKEIIAPLCMTMKPDDDGKLFPIPVSHRYDKNKQHRPYYGQGIEEVDYITGGCHLVKREVYEKLDRPYFFTYHKNGVVIYSEDAVFSQQCQKLGYKLYTHYDLICKHIRQIDVKDVNDLLVSLPK